MAKAMNHGPGGSISDVVAGVNQQRVVLKLVANGNPDLVMWMLQKEKRYFREVLGRDLVVELSSPASS
jgi:hypothetical protein